MRINITLTQTEGLKNLDKIGEQTGRNLVHLARLNTQNEVDTRTPVDTGHLRNSWIVKDNHSKGESRLYNTRNYAQYVEEGTGLHGPKKAPILPRRKKVLAWQASKKSMKYANKNGWVFAKSTKGQKGVHMAEKSIQATTKRIKDLAITAFIAATEGKGV